MNEKSPFTKVRLWLLTPVLALGLAATVGLFQKHQLGLRQNARSEEAGSELARAKSTKDAAPKESGAASSLSESLLTDSILSIVQSYYVDPGRVDNPGLLATALGALGTNPRVRSGSEDGKLWVEIDGERHVIPVHDSLSYQDLLEAFEGIAKLLDESGIEIALGEVQEKNAPGSVVLLNAMLAELDAHSSLLSPEAYRELRQGTEGSFGGLGVLVGLRDNILTVIKPLPRSPALRAGIKKHDRILGIDGVSTFGYTLEQLVEYMRGDPGTNVNLSLLRDGATSPSQMNLKREVIHVDSVQVEEIHTDGLRVLHLTVENFSSRTSREVLNAIKKARLRNHGVLHGLVLDLRSNPGGLLDQAVQVADLFLQSGVIVTTKGRREETESAGTGFDEVNFPVAVLIDGDSASASEIVAGALQDHGRAVVIGQPSFGKGSVQTIFELPGERALKLTIARYYTPAGRSIQNVGIIPDVWLQPLYKTEANDNLFGLYRYKNERFLRNHLEASHEGGKNEKSVKLPVRKAYYLAAPRAEDEEVPKAEDREMALALKMIDKIRKTYGNKLPEGTARASHWLGLAGPEIGEMTAKLDGAASNWLASKMKVKWQASKAKEDARLELKLSKANARTAPPGETVKLNWEIISRETAPVGRVSIFVRSEHTGFDTKEVLIGSVDPGVARRGTLDVAIPTYFEPGPLLLRIGLAVDAWPARSEGAAADWQIQIEPRPVAAIAASFEITEEKGGKLPRTLESSERAKLRVHLRNDGEIAAQNVTAHVVNLSGSQVQLEDLTQAVPSIAPGENVTLDWNVAGGKSIYTPEVTFGLSVESGDLKQPLRQRMPVKGMPSSEQAKMSNLTSH